MLFQVLAPFDSLVFKNENVVRKAEYDWNMVYLARGNSSKSSISK